jgi:hypothetical protein
MLSHLCAHDLSEKLERDICRANAATADVVSAVLDLALARCALPNRVHRANRIHELASAQAWTDAALALVALEPSRVLRHLIYEDGEWHCTLGSLGPAPGWLDDTLDFSHPDLALAILGALVLALGQKSHAASAPVSVPRLPAEPRDLTGYINCDNFA